MEEGKDSSLNQDVPPEPNQDATPEVQSNPKTPIKKNQRIIAGGIIAVLVLVLLIAISSGQLFQPAKTTPEITLELVSGPELEENGQYRFEIEATVSGNPIPEVVFNRDDSMGEAGENRAVIFLDSGESLILTAVARNSQGSKESQLELIAVMPSEGNGGEDPDADETATWGTIEGHLVYPSAGIPPMSIVAENVVTGVKYTTSQRINDDKYPTGVGYVIQVPPGDYHVYAVKPGDDFKAYHDKYVQSNYSVNSEEKIVVTILERQHVKEVVVGNWWRIPANQDPVVDGMVVPSGLLIPGETYSVQVQASDPDGDPLSYSWVVSGTGTADITDPRANPMRWSPSASGEYTVTVTVRDSRGGDAVKSEVITIAAVAILDPVAAETGFVVKEYQADSNASIYAGDYSNNKTCRGFISFDISAVSGTVQKVELVLAEPILQGNPEFMHGTMGLWIGVVDWGSRPLVLADYNLAGIGIRTYTDYDIALTSGAGESDTKLASELQKRINSGNDRFQIRLHYAKEGTNNDGILDGVTYSRNNVTLKIYYIE